jgi:hypothetical protein
VRKRGDVDIETQAGLWRRVAAKFGLCFVGLLAPTLFDNCIGRKRDVGGGVLAGLWSLVWVLGASFEPDPAVLSPKRQLTVTFQKFIAP